MTNIISSDTNFYFYFTSFQDGIEKVEATYEVFLMQKNLRNFKYSFFIELQTVAVQYLLNVERIKEYLQLIKSKTPAGKQKEMCQLVMQYVLVVLGKYLQIKVACHIDDGEYDTVTEDFEEFNEVFKNNLYQQCKV